MDDVASPSVRSKEERLGERALPRHAHEAVDVAL
jgi:hypothetical protein